MKEECDAELQIDQIKFLTVVNVLYPEADYHNVIIIMFTRVEKENFSFRNTEPEKCTDWRWVKWDDFLKLSPHFIPYKFVFEQGYWDLNKIK